MRSGAGRVCRVERGGERSGGASGKAEAEASRAEMPFSEMIMAREIRVPRDNGARGIVRLWGRRDAGVCACAGACPRRSCIRVCGALQGRREPGRR